MGILKWLDSTFSCGARRKTRNVADGSLGMPKASPPMIYQVFEAPKTLGFYFDTATVVWLVLCAIVALATGTVVGYPVGAKVSVDVFWAYLGFATAYAHAVVTGTYKQFGQLVGPVWLIFLLLGFYNMFLASPSTAVTFFVQSLLSLLVATYIGYKQELWKILTPVIRSLCGLCSKEFTPPALAPAEPVDLSHLAFVIEDIKQCHITSYTVEMLFVGAWAFVHLVVGVLLIIFPPHVLLGPEAVVALHYTGRHIGVFLLGWGSGMVNAIRTNTLVLYSQVYLPVLLGTSLRTIFTGHSLTPLDYRGGEQPARERAQESMYSSQQYAVTRALSGERGVYLPSILSQTQPEVMQALSLTLEPTLRRNRTVVKLKFLLWSNSGVEVSNLVFFSVFFGKAHAFFLKRGTRDFE